MTDDIISIKNYSIEMFKALGKQAGYRFEETIENDTLVVKMYRPDGTLAMVATKPVNKK